MKTVVNLALVYSSLMAMLNLVHCLVCQGYMRCAKTASLCSTVQFCPASVGLVVLHGLIIITSNVGRTTSCS